MTVFGRWRRTATIEGTTGFLIGVTGLRLGGRWEVSVGPGVAGAVVLVTGRTLGRTR